jgi:hypothetical protein
MTRMTPLLLEPATPDQIKDLYSPRRNTPVVVDVPEMLFAMIDGSGDPAGDEFQEAVPALYTFSYTAKFGLKRSAGLEYQVMPLEALWGPEEPDATFDWADRASWKWTAMIPQPGELTEKDVGRFVAEARRKREIPGLDRLRVERCREGLSAQVMHVGPYAAEPLTIERLHAFIREQGYRPRGRHHEIYLGDPRRTAPERLRTIIRQPIEM